MGTDDPHARERPADAGEAPRPQRPAAPAASSDVAIASARVAAIVEAAERAAEQLRAHTEQRANARIAEAQRAADSRVAAAEAEAADLLVEARDEAARLRAEAEAAVRAIHAEAARVRKEADAHREAQLDRTRTDVAEMLVEAQELADETRRKARADAQAIVGEAHLVARRVFREGGELSDQLDQLSTSLHRNAERLLSDIAAAHRAMVAPLEAVAPGAGEGVREPAVARAGARDDLPDADLDVPEFVPPS